MRGTGVAGRLADRRGTWAEMSEMPVKIDSLSYHTGEEIGLHKALIAAYNSLITFNQIEHSRHTGLMHECDEQFRNEHRLQAEHHQAEVDKYKKLVEEEETVVQRLQEQMGKIRRRQ